MSSKKSTPNSQRSSLSEIKAAKRAAMKKALDTSSDEIKDPFQSALDAKDLRKKPTALVYDDFMLKHHNPWDRQHIEDPERLRRSYERCQELGLIDRCHRIPARKATADEILKVHNKEYMDLIDMTVKKPIDEIKTVALGYFHSVYLSNDSFESALLAAGSTIDLTNAIVKGEVANGIALVRPPGHHAMKKEGNGFCIFNNVAIAARHALDNLDLKKILIVDFDVHHGQGIQYEFFSDPRVLYFSAHRYEFGAFWPHLRESNFDSVGEKEGAGFNVNVPLNQIGLGDADYLAMWHQLLMPLANEYSPELILVSAGFDAAIGDPEGEMALTPAAYGHLISSLMSLSKGKVGVVLEGGYFVESLADGVAMTIRSLIGDECASLGPVGPPSDSMVESILSCISALKPYWQCFQLFEEYSISEYDAEQDKDCHVPTIVFEGHNPQFETATQPGESYFIHAPEKADGFLNIVQSLRAQTFKGLNVVSHNKRETAMAYDQLMKRHKNMEEPNHPERPMRIEQIYNTHKEFGLLDRAELLRVASRRAKDEEILLKHDKKYLEDLKDLPSKTQKELEEIGDSFDSIYLNPDSFDCALLSCGSLLNVVDSVCNDTARNGVAIIRPPGHHAEEDEACGFCLFNNVSVAAEYALKVHDIKRVMIFDWDVHHGNGIQNMFYDDPRVLYVSVHRFDHGTFFPSRPNANYDFVGEGKGEGFNVNIPWNKPGMGDPEYAAAFFSVILPIAYQFDPELIFISAGFDAARGDPLGHCKVSPEMYAHMTHHLQNLAHGRVITALEGGYNLNSIALSMTMCTKALLGDPLPPLDLAQPVQPSAVVSIRDVIRTQKAYWSCLKFDKKLPDSFEDLKGQMLSESKLEKEAEAVATIPPPIPTSFPIQVIKSDPVEVRTTVPSLVAKVKKQEDYIPFEYGNSYGSSSSSQFTWTTSAQKVEYVSTLSKQFGTSVLMQTHKVDVHDSTATTTTMAGLEQAMRGLYIPNQYPMGEDTSIPGTNTFSTSMAGEKRKNNKKEDDKSNERS